jgi:hypothetical protein
MFLMAIDTQKLMAAAPGAAPPRGAGFQGLQARLARGGRVVFTRLDALADEERDEEAKARVAAAAAAPWPPRPTLPAVLEVCATVEQQYQQRMQQQLLANMGRPPGSQMPAGRPERPISALTPPRAATPKPSASGAGGGGTSMAAAAAAVAAAAAAAAAASPAPAAAVVAAPAAPAVAATPAPAAAAPSGSSAGTPASGLQGLPSIVIKKHSAGPKPAGGDAPKPPLGGPASGLKRGPGRPPKVTGVPGMS